MGTESKTPARSRSSASKTTATSKVAAPRKRTTDGVAAAPRRSTRKASPQKQITAEERLRYIEVAAYYIAEQRGFAGGDPSEDWKLAERQVDSLLLEGKLPA